MSYLSRKSKPKQSIKPSNQRNKPLGCLDETTNQRLNAMYQKFISKNRQSNPILKAKVSEQSSNLNMRSQNSPIDQDIFFNKYQISIDKDISIEGIKMRFEDVIEAALQNYDAATQQYLNFIYQKFSKEVQRLRNIEELVGRLQGKLNVSNLKFQESTILRQLNKELESKIIYLESEVSTLKANKELSGLRSTLEKARQNNSVRERNPTPGKDSRFDIEKKLLIKQNLELKKELQNTKKEYELRLQQISSLNDKNDQSIEQTDRKHGYQQILMHAEGLENQLQTLEYQLERKSKIIHDLQEEIKQAENKPIEENQNYRLKYEVVKTDLDSKITMWNKRLQSKQSQLNQMRNKVLSLQQQSLQVKKDNIKKEARETNNLKEIQSMKTQIDTLKQTIKNNKKADVPKKDDDKDIDYEQLKTENQKLKAENSKLASTIITLNSKPSQAESLRTENTVLKQVLKSEKDKSIPKSSIMEAVKKIINIEPPKLKESLELNTLLTDLYEELEKARQEMLEHQLQLKQLRLHKNKIDHILHQQDEVNDFQTTQIDAHFYRSKPATDAVMKQQLKKLATKLDYQLNANIETNKQIKSTKAKIKVLEENQRKITEHLRGIVDEDITIDKREQHLTGLLEWSGLEELTSLYHDKLFA